LSEELTTSITKALERSGPLSLEEVQAKLPQSTEAKIRSELSALVNAKKVRRSPRGQYYVHGHVVSPVPPPSVRGGTRLPSFEQGTVSDKGGGFVFGGRSVAPGDSLTNRDLMSAFAVGSMRGIRISRPTGCILLISSADNSLFKDRSHDGVFDYTGEGRYGDQEMTRIRPHLDGLTCTYVRTLNPKVIGSTRRLYDRVFAGRRTAASAACASTIARCPGHLPAEPHTPMAANT